MDDFETEFVMDLDPEFWLRGVDKALLRALCLCPECDGALALEPVLL